MPCAQAKGIEVKVKLSYSFGIIDMLHFGHIKTLSKAKINSDYHIFGLVRDEVSLAWMGNVVSNLEERKAVLESLKQIDVRL